MTEIDLLGAIAQVGFPIAVAAFLLWKGYTQDQQYLEVLQQLKAEIEELRKEHTLMIHGNGSLK